MSNKTFEVLSRSTGATLKLQTELTYKSPPNYSETFTFQVKNCKKYCGSRPLLRIGCIIWNLEGLHTMLKFIPSSKSHLLTIRMLHIMWFLLCATPSKLNELIQYVFEL